MEKWVIDKLKENEKFHTYLRENSSWYRVLNRNPYNYDLFIKKMKEKYKLRTIDKVDNFVDSVDLITKIINMSND